MTSAVVAQLPLRVEPHHDESLIGFLARTASRNAIPNPYRIIRAYGIDASTLEAVATKPVDLKAFAKLTGQPAATLERMAYLPTQNKGRVNFLGHPIDREFVTVQHRRYCGRCLEEAPYHRALWDLSVVTLCPEHGVELLCHCPQCSRKVGWTVSGLTQCRCGATLTKADPQVGPEAELATVKYIIGRLTGSDSAPSLTGLAPGDELELIYVLGCYGLWDHRPRPISVLAKGHLALDILAVGMDAIRDLPASFDAWCQTMVDRNAGGGRRYGFGKAFGAFAEYTTDPMTNPAIRDFLDTYLRDFLTQNGIATRVESIGTSDFITLTEASSKLERYVVTVRDVLRRHNLIAVDDRAGSGAPILIAADLVESLAAELKDLRGKSALRRLLGCSRTGLETLLNAGWFDVAVGPAADLFGKPCWSSRAALKFIGEVVPPVTVKSARHTIPMAVAVSMDAYSHVDWSPSAIKRLVKSRSRHVADIGLRGILLDRTKLRQLGAQTSKWLTIPEMAVDLKVKQEVAYFLVRHGFLRAHSRPGVRGSFVSCHQVQAFSNEHFIPSRSGLDVGRYPGWTTEQLLAEGIEPVTGPKLDGSRQYIFRRADAARSSNPAIKAMAASNTTSRGTAIPSN